MSRKIARKAYPKYQFNIHITSALDAQLTNLANAIGVSKSTIGREVIEAFLERREVMLPTLEERAAVRAEERFGEPVPRIDNAYHSGGAPYVPPTAVLPGYVPSESGLTHRPQTVANPVEPSAPGRSSSLPAEVAASRNYIPPAGPSITGAPILRGIPAPARRSAANPYTR